MTNNNTMQRNKLFTPRKGEYCFEHKHETKIGETGILYRLGENQCRVPYHDIQYLKADLKYVDIVTASGNKYITELSLVAIRTLAPPDIFIQTHRAYLINRHFLSGIERRSATEWFAILSTGEKVEIARRRRQVVKKELRR